MVTLNERDSERFPRLHVCQRIALLSECVVIAWDAAYSSFSSSVFALFSISFSFKF